MEWEDALVYVVLGGLILGVVGGIIFGPDAIAYYTTPHKVIVGTVTDKYIKRYNEKDIFFIVVKGDDGKTYVLQDTDTIFGWKWNSADIYAKIVVGHRYKFVVYGWRIPMFSVFPNILKVEPVGS